MPFVQVYHMCDELGRQFSYACPNTTLFQQRMLICDHWYMVNCSDSESNYDANLLIGKHKSRTNKNKKLQRMIWWCCSSIRSTWQAICAWWWTRAEDTTTGSSGSSLCTGLYWRIVAEAIQGLRERELERGRESSRHWLILWPWKIIFFLPVEFASASESAEQR